MTTATLKTESELLTDRDTAADVEDWRTVDEIDIILQKMRDPRMVYCYNCEEFVVFEEDSRGCGCHCPKCNTTL